MAVGLQSRDSHARGHFELLVDFSGFRINSPQLTLVTFPGSVPELVVDPGNAGDVTVGFDGAKDRAGFRIDLMDLAVPVLPHPQCPFSPREAGVAALAGSIFWMRFSAI
jgi:hypothetical protein